jgi:hypothetical protein
LWILILIFCFWLQTLAGERKVAWDWHLVYICSRRAQWVQEASRSSSNPHRCHRSHEKAILLIGFRAHKLRPTRTSSSTFALICMLGLD